DATALPVATPIDEIAAVNASSVTALRSANPRTAKLGVISGASVSGRGGGQFRWDAASTDADDGALTLLPTGWSGAGRWKRVCDPGVLRVSWFGAVGDGTTNDLAAIRAAIAACPAGGTVILDRPAAFYR